ncbi:MAG: class I SAM-dependent methyltransferase, partial [Chloroflexota bacterium]
LFAYARPDHLQRTLACLRENQVPLIYAFSDGALTPEKQSAVDEVRHILRSIDWCEVILTERSENLGLGRSILRGVAEVLQEHEAVIVFEDDLVCVPGTYQYLCAALRHYAADERVMSVTGWTHPRVIPSDVTDQPYFDGRAECWVWGTWRRTWQGMGQNAAQLIKECKRDKIDPFRYGADLVAQAQNELTQNIWAVRFLYLHIRNRKLCLRPPYSMVEHIGFDINATNFVDSAGWNNPVLQAAPQVPKHWPEAFENSHCVSLWQVAAGERPTPFDQMKQYAKNIIRPLYRATIKGVFKKYIRRQPPASEQYTVLDDVFPRAESGGWHQAKVVERQHQAFQALIRQMYAGDTRLDFNVLAQAVEQTQIRTPSLLEIGCGSGYYSEVLPYLLKEKIQYTGLDFSHAMVSLGHQQYTAAEFLQGDATALPFADKAFDIVVNGTALMHIVDYKNAIAEASRVARSWCIFHTVPVLQQRETSILRKQAYGEPVLEIIFNETELIRLFTQYGLAVQTVLESIDYNLVQVLHEKTTTKTYLCRIKET